MQILKHSKTVAFLMLALLPASITVGKAQDEDDWRALHPENTLYIEMEAGRVVVELAPHLAPQNVAQIKRLVREGRYDDASFYRVIENFVAQGGLYEGAEGIPELPAEFELPAAEIMPFTPVEGDETFAPETGFHQGFAMGRDGETGSAWAIHCPGVMAMARNVEPDTASSEFYFPIGQAPRHLDRNLTVIGRVISGFRHIQGARRGDRAVQNGVIENPVLRTPIKSMAIAADLDISEREKIAVMRTDSAAFAAVIDGARNRTSDFWHKTPSTTVDICTINVPSRRF